MSHWRLMPAAALAASFLAGCARLSPRKPAPSPQPRVTAPRVNVEAQSKAYDSGVAHFGEERYLEARKAWAEAYRLGPTTAVGKRAQANLQKVDAMLKRLQELERQ